MALCRERLSKPEQECCLHSVLQSGARKEIPSWLPSPLCRLGASVLVWLFPAPPETLHAHPSPKCQGKTVLMQGPARPRGTGFAEQAAIQYFVFSSLFNVWPQAKPCSEYRTGAFLTGFSTGSPRAVAGQFTSTFIVMHPHFPN